MITLNNITKKYGDTTILDRTSYAFPQKGLVCIMGASGGGKTTLLNLIAGFDSDYTGDIVVADSKLSEMDEAKLCNYRRAQIGFVFQSYHLLSGYTAIENIILAMELSKIHEDDAYKMATDMLVQLGLADKVNQQVETLSGGQKQRVAIARALIGSPHILLCDEPTGALDRKTSGEIMELLQEISKTRLVVVITHDEKLLPFADEVLRIENKSLVSQLQTQNNDGEECIMDDENTLAERGVAQPLRRAGKNFKVHFKRYMAIAFAISIGLTAFLFSISFGNVMGKSIADFQEKNTALHNGYIKGVDDGTNLKMLKKDERIDNVYYQYKLVDIDLVMDDKSEKMLEKIPMPKTTQAVSYGVMPRHGKNEISLTPSLAKKFASDISGLIGKQITVKYDGVNYSLTISGIYNAGYDDFMISSDVEQKLYAKMNGEENYSISYDVKKFEDIVAVSDSLEAKKIDAENATKEVGAMLETFKSLQRLFLIVSVLVLAIALFLCTVLLVRQQNTRYREVGLLSALGFRRREISAILRSENMLMSGLSAIINAVLVITATLLCSTFGLSFSLGLWQVLICTVSAFVIILTIGELSNVKLIKTQPADALRK